MYIVKILSQLLVSDVRREVSQVRDGDLKSEVWERRSPGSPSQFNPLQNISVLPYPYADCFYFDVRNLFAGPYSSVPPSPHYSAAGVAEP